MQRSTSVDFNCLDLVISVESWVVVIDFFSAVPSELMPTQVSDPVAPTVSMEESNRSVYSFI